MTQVYDDTARFTDGRVGVVVPVDPEYDGPFWASSDDPPQGGHPGHLEGGREMSWELAAQLNMALQAHRAEIDRLRAYVCPCCGMPGASSL